MRLMEIKHPRELLHHWLFYIVVITAIAIFLRALPALLNAAWGCDFGIYYGLTSSFISSGELYGESTVWGGSYQYFPVLFAITGIAHWLTGIDLLTLMPKLVPIFGGLSIFIFYFIVNELLGDRKKALLSSLFLAVIPIHVYQTSQAAPLTIGHFFFMLSLLFFIKSRVSSRYIIPLVLSTSLLILTHHLTMYFFLITIVFIVFIENARQNSWTKSFRNDIIYIIGTSAGTFMYWSVIATPVYESFMNHGIFIAGFTLSANAIIILFYLLIAAIIGIILIIRRLRPVQIKKRVLTPSSPLLYVIVFIGIISIVGLVLSFNLPWATLYFTPKSVLYSLPLLAVVSLGFVGIRHLKQIPNWEILCGWFFSLSLSFIYGMITLNRALLPHRHLEYIMAPLSIFVIYGLYSLAKYDFTFLAAWKMKILKSRQLIFPLTVVVLVASNAASVYPSYLAWESLEESYETITDDNMAVIAWIEENLDQNNSVIASDHRLALLAGAVGFNTTRDQTIYLWNTSDEVYYVDELFGGIYNYSRVSHVIIDSIMRDQVVHIGFDGKKAFMTNESYKKFLDQPFNLIYRNVSYINELEEGHWTEIYAVNWTYIEHTKWPFPSLYFIYNECNNRL